MTGEEETNIIMCCQSPGLEMDSVSVEGEASRALARTLV